MNKCYLFVTCAREVTLRGPNFRARKAPSFPRARSKFFAPKGIHFAPRATLFAPVVSELKRSVQRLYFENNNIKTFETQHTFKLHHKEQLSRLHL